MNPEIADYIERQLAFQKEKDPVVKMEMALDLYFLLEDTPMEAVMEGVETTIARLERQLTHEQLDAFEEKLGYTFFERLPREGDMLVWMESQKPVIPGDVFHDHLAGNIKVKSISRKEGKAFVHFTDSNHQTYIEPGAFGMMWVRAPSPTPEK
jgi:hypothetical protein